MTALDETERNFQTLHGGVVQAYEQRVARWNATKDERRKRQQADEADLREMLKRASIDLDLLDKRDQRDADALEAFLERERPALLNRQTAALDYKQRALQAGLLADTCQTKIPVFAASLISANPAHLDGVAGEHHGMWVFPDNPGQIELFDSGKGSGTGWGAEAGPPPPTATVWFTFVPPVTGNWELSAILAFHGFYIARADDGIFTHKEARIRLQVSLDIHQYFWIGEKVEKLIDIDESDINETEFFDRTKFFFNTTFLRAGDPVLVKVEILASALADGSGSYAEINFRDGAANFIEPLFMSVQTL